MKGALLIARREAYAYLRSPLGAAVIAAVLLGEGLYFYWSGLTERRVSAEVLQDFFNIASGGILLATPVLSMRLVAEERQTGTMTLPNTAPVRDRDIVLGKFISAFAMIGLMTALSFYMPALIFVNGKVSLGHIAVGYLGVLLLGAAVTSIGLFASSLSRSQVLAVILTAAILVPLLLMWMVARAVDPPLNEVVAALALHHDNYRPFMQGTLKLGSVAYYVAVSFFFLLSAIKVLEARRWH